MVDPRLKDGLNQKSRRGLSAGRQKIVRELSGKARTTLQCQSRLMLARFHVRRTGRPGAHGCGVITTTVMTGVRLFRATSSGP
jgi:hypothetical protein